MLKTFVAILFTATIFGFNYISGISLGDGYCYVSGLFAVLGHVFPIFYGFKGGKGVLVTATMALILTPVAFLFLLVIFVLIVAMSKYVSLGSISVAILYPVVVNFYVNFVFSSSASALLLICTMILAVFIVWCHRENIKRISDRTERKISIGGKKKKDEDEDE
jgi:glycerol-3-phosphate acyltransferase PlsY